MANTATSVDLSDFGLDIQQLQLDVQHRWLRPPEVAEILRNYHKFQFSTEPPHRPPSGSLFLFNKKVLRNFRKDGHRWRKSKDGKTVKEAHENLKIGSVNILHCYYAVGEENACFRRRSYWLLEKEFRHIIFVHYLEVKGMCIRKKIRSVMSNSKLSNPLASSVLMSHNEAHAGNAGSSNAASTSTSTNEDIECGSKNGHKSKLNEQKCTSPSLTQMNMHGQKLICPDYLKYGQISQQGTKEISRWNIQELIHNSLPLHLRERETQKEVIQVTSNE